MATIDGSQAEEMLRALGEDLRWRLIKADDQHYTRGEHGHWLENSRETIGRQVTDMPLNRLDDQFSWHVRPMPRGGPYRLTLLDDATQETIVRMRDEGLPPTAVVRTSENCYQVWHRWPWDVPRQKMPRLLQHLQQHFGTDQGSNMPGHCGRLAGSRNWKRIPVDREGCPVALTEINPPLTRDQAKKWLDRYPIPKLEPKPVERPSGVVNNFDLDDPRYREKLENELRELPNAWNVVYAKTGNAHRADWQVAISAVSLQLSDSTITGILSEYVHQKGRNHHGSGYIALTIRKARDRTGVRFPGVWGGGGAFDPKIKFPYLRESQKPKEKDRDPEAER